MGLLAQRQPRLRGRALVEVRHATRILVGARERFEREGDFARELLERHDPERVLAYWVWNRVALRAIHRAAITNLTPDLWSDAKERLGVASLELAARQELSALRATRLLEQAGVRCAVFKGPTTARQAFGDVAMRDPAADIDILVDGDNLAAAETILRTHGWNTLPEPQPFAERPSIHNRFSGSPLDTDLEVHWRVQTFDRDEHTSAVLSELERCAGLPVLTLDGLASVLLLCWARDGFHKLRLGADIAGCADQRDLEHAICTNTTEPALITARTAAHLVLGVPLPVDTPSQLTSVQQLALHIATEDRQVARSTYSGVIAATALALSPVEARRDQRRIVWSASASHVVGPQAGRWAAPLRLISVVRLGFAGASEVVARVWTSLRRRRP